MKLFSVIITIAFFYSAGSSAESVSAADNTKSPNSISSKLDESCRSSLNAFKESCNSLVFPSKLTGIVQNISKLYQTSLDTFCVQSTDAKSLERSLLELQATCSMRFNMFTLSCKSTRLKFHDDSEVKVILETVEKNYRQMEESFKHFKEISSLLETSGCHVDELAKKVSEVLLNVLKPHCDEKNKALPFCKQESVGSQQQPAAQEAPPAR